MIKDTMLFCMIYMLGLLLHGRRQQLWDSISSMIIAMDPFVWLSPLETPDPRHLAVNGWSCNCVVLHHSESRP